MRILSASDVSSILLNLDSGRLERLQDSLSQALSAYSDHHGSSTTSVPPIIQPLRTVMTTDENITVLSMPVSDSKYTSVKTVTVPPGGPIRGAITIYDATGGLVGLLNAAEVTAFRTALTSMLALFRSKWGRKSATAAPSSGKHNLVVFGGGKQAEWHTRLALQISTIDTVTLVNRSQKRLDELEDGVLKNLRSTFPHVTFNTLSQEANDQFNDRLREALSSSDIICCTTPSTAPLFPFEHLQYPAKSRFISLIGSYKPNMQEIDSETLLSGHKNKIIVDSREACLEEAGELRQADVKNEQLVEIGTIYSNNRDRKGDIEEEDLLAPSSANVIFKCVGLSLMDLAVSKTLLEMAEDVNVGTEMNDF